MDRQEQAGRQDAQLTDPVLPPADAGGAAAGAGAARWRLAAFAAVLALTALRLVYLAVSPIELDFEEAQYWFWAQAPDWGYFSKPPLIAWLIAVSTAVLGDGEFGVRAWSPILHGAAALCLGGIGARLGGPRVGFWAALAYASLPGVSFSALLMTTDAPLAFGWSLALLAVVRLADRDGDLWAAIGGVAAGLGLLAKYSMLFFLPGAVLALLLLPEWRRRIPARRLALFAGLALLLLLPNLLWNFAQGGITVSHTLALAAAGGAGPRLGSVLAFLGGQLAIAGPLIVPMAAAIWTGIASIGKPDRAGRRPLLLLACFVLPFFILYLPLALTTRANANWTGMAYVGATAAAILFAMAPDRRRWIRPILGLQLAVAVVGPALIVAAPSLRLGIAERLVDRVSGWRELGEALARDLTRRPDARVLFFDATLAKRLIYYARIGRDGFAMWNPEGTAHNELDRIASLEPGAPGPWLVVSDRPLAEAALPALFSNVGPTTELGTSLPSGEVRRLVLQEVGGFEGYPR